MLLNDRRRGFCQREFYRKRGRIARADVASIDVELQPCIQPARRGLP